MHDNGFQKAARAGLAVVFLAASPVGFAATAQASADALTEAAGSYHIDKTSSIRFAVDQIGGGGIRGSFGDYKGSFSIDGRDVGKSTVMFTLYPKSVHANEARVEDFLRSDAVFDAEEYPEVTFRSTAVTRTGGSTATIKGVLTARGKSRPTELQATVTERRGGAIAFHVTGSIYRSPYGMGVGTPLYSNLVQFDMTLHGTRN
ncbi:MAG: YceI family protein [Hyphomicrobiales bacterium]|nr:YceI family protein [Hyphomicrobiales bacterium]